MKYEAGYVGKKDELRDKAEKLWGNPNSAIVKKKVESSFSSPARTKTRFYKDGGKVEKHSLTKEQTDLVLPRLGKATKFEVKSLEGNGRYKKGGRKGK